MFKKNWPFILSAIFILTLSGFFFYLYVKSPTLDWSPNYNHNNSSPYGTELLYQVIKDIYPEKKFTTIEEPLTYNREFNNEKGSGSIYLFCGKSFTPDRSTVASLSKFINNGNQVFIAADGISSFFIDSLLNSGNYAEYGRNSATSSFECIAIKPYLIHPDFKLNKTFSIKNKYFQYAVPMLANYLSQEFVNNHLSRNDYYKIGYFEVVNNDAYVNYIKIKVGKGWLHLYTNPVLFTNYHLRKKYIFEYSKNIFQHLVPGNIYWHVNSYVNMDQNVTEIEQDKNPFGVLLSFRSFRYAWYTFCSAILLFSLFGIKRKQRPIPVLEKNTNSSIEFAETISKLYLTDGRHKNIALQKYRYFFNFIKTKYGINLKDKQIIDMEMLSQSSKVSREIIGQIMVNYAKIKSLPNTTSHELHEAVELINGFYKATS